MSEEIEDYSQADEATVTKSGNLAKAEEHVENFLEKHNRDVRKDLDMMKDRGQAMGMLAENAKRRFKLNFAKALTRTEVLSRLQTGSRSYEQLMAYYRCAMMEVETKFKVLNEEFSLQYDRNPIESIKTRLKDPRSLLEKLNRKELPFSLEAVEENIHDVAGVRVVCSFVEDIYLLADCLLKQDDITLLETKDYIKNPKQSGYRSLHLIIAVPIYLSNEKRSVKVEVQLRTIAMDFWASLEHKLKYKKEIENAEALAAELYECADLSARLDMRMQGIRKRIEEENS